MCPVRPAEPNKSGDAAAVHYKMFINLNALLLQSGGQTVITKWLSTITTGFNKVRPQNKKHSEGA